MLDNVITINQTPVPESRLTCDKYRAIGLGTSGYHHYLVKHGLRWESKEHIAAADALLKRLPTMPSKRPWNFPKKRGLILPSRDLNGIRANTLPGAAIPVKMAASCCRRPQVRYAQWVSPCCGANRFNEQHCQYNGWHRSYFQEILHRGKQGSFTPKTAPDLNPKTFWLYKEAHTIDQQWSIRANAARQRHIDQAQSFNLYITPRMKASEILNLYIEAYKQGIKTIYYVRNQSLEMDECTSCSS